MNSAAKIILGIILILVPLILAIIFGSWGHAVVEFLKAIVIILIIVVGIFLVIIGANEGPKK